MDVQAPLNFPDAGRDGLHDRNAKVLLERHDDTERVEARSQDVDGIGLRASVQKSGLSATGMR
jgi:hypothetical protein